MLAAQLHNKMRRAFEDKEDVLTSSLFALLRYLPRDLASYLLTKWADIPIQQGPVEVAFWPSYPTPSIFGIFIGSSDRGETEPDVVIRTGEWLVVVEVKYLSHLDPAYDQLGREFAIGYELAEREGRHFRLLVVTADVLPPRPGGLDLVTGIQCALTEVRHDKGRVSDEMIASVPLSLQWTSWHRIYDTLLRTTARPDAPVHSRRLLEDARALLELRGLRPYSIAPLARAMNRWDRVGIPDDAWRSPMS